MTDPFTCSRCAAPVTNASFTNCPYCGAVLERGVAATPDAVRFAAVERSPEFPQLMRLEPSASGAILGLGLAAVFLTMWTMSTAGFTLVSLGIGAAGGFMQPRAAPFAMGGAVLFTLIPMLMTLLGGAGVVFTVRKMLAIKGAPLERVVALVRDERTEVRKRIGKDGGVTTDYYLLLERRSGERTEYEVGGALAGKVAPGDIGVAYLRSGIILDFKRVAI